MLHVRITSAAPPTISWRCPRCSCAEFACSERFRMNSNGKLADIWLIYRCLNCDATKNVTIVERKPISKIDRALFDAATANDAVVARRLARDPAVLKRARVHIARGDLIETDAVGMSGSTFRLVFDEPLLVRLDHVLGAVTGLSRARIRAMDAAHQLLLKPRRALTRLALTDDTEVRLFPPAGHGGDSATIAMR